MPANKACLACKLRGLAAMADNLAGDFATFLGESATPDEWHADCNSSLIEFPFGGVLRRALNT
jgi:hypothetical protein